MTNLSNFEALLAHAEYAHFGGPDGIDAYNADREYWAGGDDEDGEKAYEAMLDRDASIQTEIDARYGM